LVKDDLVGSPPGHRALRMGLNDFLGLDPAAIFLVMHSRFQFGEPAGGDDLLAIFIDIGSLGLQEAIVLTSLQHGGGATETASRPEAGEGSAEEKMEYFI